MIDVSERSMCTTLLGEEVRLPIGISPTALHSCYHSGGELSTATGNYIYNLQKHLNEMFLLYKFVTL